MRKKAYGAKAKRIEEKYAKYVPRNFVPDRYKVPMNGYTSVSKVWRQSKIDMSNEEKRKLGALHESSTGATEKSDKKSFVAPAAMTAGGPIIKRVRWSSAVHQQLLTQALLDAPFCGKLPKWPADWAWWRPRCLAPKMARNGM